MKVELKNVASVFNGKTPSKAEQRDVGFPVLKIKDIDENGFFKGQFDCFIDQKLADGLLKKHVHIGDILILNAAHNSKYVGSKKCFVSEDFAGALATGEWTIVRSNQNKVLPKFLFFILDTAEFQFELQNVIKGIHLYPKDLNEIKIFCPSLEEQKRIVRILDQADSLRQKRQKAISLLDDYLKAVFLEMFGDPKMNPKGFPLVELKELYIDKKNGTKCGPFGSALKKEEFVNCGIPVWNMDNISKTGQMVMPFRMWITPEKYYLLEAYSVIDGDVIISRAGTVGKMCVVKTGNGKSIISTNLIRVRFGEKLLPLYFVSLMNYCKTRLGRLKTGADGAFTHMSTGVLDKLTFPYPTLDLQNKFADIVQQVENLKQSMLTQYKELDTNFNSLMQGSLNL